MGTEGARGQFLVERVCARLCGYYKPGKAEEERCGGWEWLLRRGGSFTPALEGLEASPERPRRLAHDAAIEAAVCATCPFRAADCDYRDPAGPPGAPPCGGVEAVDQLLSAGVLSEVDLSPKQAARRDKGGGAG